MKVKFFRYATLAMLEQEINNFIEQESVIDIKLAVQDHFFVAMVMYHDVPEV